MSKEDQASLILKLYELRREATMREARDWYFLHFAPQSFDEFNAYIMGEHSGHLRMVVSYWDMAAALVNHGAIDLELFNSVNNEHFTVFSVVEPLLGEIRAAYGPLFAANLERLMHTTPGSKERLEAVRARIKSVRERIAKQAAGAAKS